MRTLASLIAVLACLGLAGSAHAQTATGQITGTVTDSTGAVMPGVKVVVTSQQTGLTRETTTSDVGSYVVPLLPVGIYLVTAEQSGFKLAVQSDIQLNVDQVQRIDLKLEAGNVSERVEVRANASTLDTETSTVGQVISETAGHAAAAQRPQLSPAAVPRRRARRDQWRAGRYAPGRGQRDQHHGIAADVEQLHDRWHVERRHVARHAGGDPLHRHHPGVQGADRHLLSRVRLQRQPDQHRQQVGDERLPRIGVRVLQERKRWMRGTSSIRGMRRSPNWIRNSRDSTSAGRFACRSTTAATRRSSCSTTRRRESSGARARSTPCRRPDELSGHFNTTIIDPATGQPFPNNTIPQERWSRLAQAHGARGTRRRIRTPRRGTTR